MQVRVAMVRKHKMKRFFEPEHKERVYEKGKMRVKVRVR